MAKTTNKNPPKQPEVKKTEVKPKDLKKVKKADEVKKAVEAAVTKVSEKKSVSKQAVTATEIKSEKKIKAKLNKEEDISRRLTRARSSLSAGLDAAMKSESKAGQKSSNMATIEAGQSYVKPTLAVQPKKQAAAVNFDDLIASAPVAEQPLQEPKRATPLKTTGGKVSFDELMANSAVVQDPGAEFTYRK